MIKGFELSYDGVGEQANKGLRYLNPFLSTSRRVFAELTADQAALENLIVDGSKLSGALAAAPATSRAGRQPGPDQDAIGDRTTALAEAISLLPDFMRQANTTFVNLRAALDDVDPLVAASKPVAARLGPSSPSSAPPPPTRCRRSATSTRSSLRPGKANDLVELTALQPGARRGGDRLRRTRPAAPAPTNAEDLQPAADDDFTQGAFGESICALDNGLDALAFFRAYTPELVGWFDDFSHIGRDRRERRDRRASARPSTPSPPRSRPAPPTSPTLARPERAARGAQLRRRSRAARAPTSADPGDDSTPFTDGGALTTARKPRRVRPDRRSAGAMRRHRAHRSPRPRRSAAPLFAAGAGADDTREYKIEMYNAFGIVEGSDVRDRRRQRRRRDRARHQRGQARRGLGRAQRRPRRARRATRPARPSRSR